MTKLEKDFREIYNRARLKLNIKEAIIYTAGHLNISVEDARAMWEGNNQIRSPIKIRLACTEQYVDENTVAILNCEKDISGRDIVTFTCPVCSKEHKSMRYGR